MLHSCNDQPSIIKGTVKKWHRYGILHRDDKPAIIEDSPTKYREEWWYYGVLCTMDRYPAIVEGKNKDYLIWYEPKYDKAGNICDNDFVNANFYSYFGVLQHFAHNAYCNSSNIDKIIPYARPWSDQSEPIEDDNDT
jgi:hypothetical protein